MPNFVMDIVIEQAQVFSHCPPVKKTPVWISIHADGVTQGFNTKPIQMAQTLSWNAPARFILNLPRLDDGYMSCVLCTYDPKNQNQTIILAKSQIMLNVLPFGSPKKLFFPLKSTYDISKDAVRITLTATISMLQSHLQIPTVQPQTEPPLYSGPPPNSMYGPPSNNNQSYYPPPPAMYPPPPPQQQQYLYVKPPPGMRPNNINHNNNIYNGSYGSGGGYNNYEDEYRGGGGGYNNSGYGSGNFNNNEDYYGGGGGYNNNNPKMYNSNQYQQRPMTQQQMQQIQMPVNPYKSHQPTTSAPNVSGVMPPSSYQSQPTNRPLVYPPFPPIAPPDAVMPPFVDRKGL